MQTLLATSSITLSLEKKKNFFLYEYKNNVISNLHLCTIENMVSIIQKYLAETVAFYAGNHCIIFQDQLLVTKNTLLKFGIYTFSVELELISQWK